MKLKPVLAACCVLVVQLKSISAEPFICPSDGRYQNPESADCRTYYNCAWTTDGILVATQTKCPGTTVFDESIQKCVSASLYTCPGPVTSTTEAVTTKISATESPNDFTCPSEGRHSNPESADCRTYYNCAWTTDGILVATQTKCPGTTVFDDSIQKCVSASLYTCPGPVTSTTEAATTKIHSTESPNDFTCPSEGRHSNPESADCRTYYNCAWTTDGTLVATQTKCPGTTVFDELIQKCVSASLYICPGPVASTTIESSTEPAITSEPITTTPEPSIDPTTTSKPSTTPAVTTTELLPTTLEPFFVCSTSGRFPNPEQSDCQTYKYCLQTSASTFQEYTFRCPAGSNFNPIEARCTVGYVCPKTLTTTTTTEATTPAPLVSSFVCQEEGRFPDPESCNRYIFCTRNVDGTLVQHAFKCPPNSWFKPNESRCSATYVCN